MGVTLEGSQRFGDSFCFVFIFIFFYFILLLFFFFLEKEKIMKKKVRLKGKKKSHCYFRPVGTRPHGTVLAGSPEAALTLLPAPRRWVIGVTVSWVLAVCTARPLQSPTRWTRCGQLPGAVTVADVLVRGQSRPLPQLLWEEHCTNWMSCLSSLFPKPPEQPSHTG